MTCKVTRSAQTEDDLFRFLCGRTTQECLQNSSGNNPVNERFLIDTEGVLCYDEGMKVAVVRVKKNGYNRKREGAVHRIEVSIW